MAKRVDTPDEEDSDLQEQVRKHIQQARTQTSNWRTEARECYDMRDGHQWPQEDLAMLREQLRPVAQFNRIGPVLDAVAGSEVSNRQEVTYLGRSSEDDGQAAMRSAAAKWARDNCDAEDEESDAFLDMITCGMGWTETRMDYEIDPEGMIVIERVDPLEMFWDPGAKKKNLTDAGWMARSRFWGKKDILATWPQAKEIMEANDPYGDIEQEAEQDSPHLADKQDPYAGESNDEVHKNRGKFRIVEYQWFEREPVYRVVDPTQGKVITLDAGQHARLKKATEKADMAFDSVKQTKKVYKRAFFLGAEKLEEGPCPCPYTFTFKAMCAKRDRNTNTWYGLVRAMKDPQQWANKWLSQALHIFNSQAKGGIMAEEDAFADVRKAERDWARPDAITMVNPGALEKGKILPKPVADYPASMDKLMTFAISSIRDVTGVNLELLGLADRQQAGILEQQRAQAGLTILAQLFDSLRRYRKEQGRLLLSFIRDFISDGRLIRILGEDGEPQLLPLMKDATSGTYDIVVDDAPSSPNQKEKTWTGLAQLVPQIQDKIPPKLWVEIVKAAPLPYAFIQKAVKILNEAMAQPPPPDPKMEVEKLKGQVMMQKAQADMALKGKDMELKQMDLQLKQQDMQVEAVKAGLDIQAAQQKGMLDERKMKMEATTSAMKAGVDMEKNRGMLKISKEKNDQQTEFNREKHDMNMEQLDAERMLAGAEAKGADAKQNAALEKMAREIANLKRDLAKPVKIDLIRENGKITGGTVKRGGVTQKVTLN